MRRPLTVIALFASLAAHAPESAFAAREKWFDLYHEAIAAIEQGDGESAVELLGRAMEKKQQGGYFRTYGNNYIRYAPQLYLGVAYHDLDRCEDALEAFGRSVADGETRDDSELDAKQRALSSACEARLAPAPEPIVITKTVEPEPRVIPRTNVDRQLMDRAIAHYSAGEFEPAVTVLEEIAGDAPKSATVQLLLAAAIHGTASTSDDEMSEVENVRAALRRAIELDPSTELDPRYFSPKLIELLRDVR